MRGYRNSNWLLEPTGCLTSYTAEADGQLDLIGRHQVIGSRVHLNFAAQPALLGGFFQPCPRRFGVGHDSSNAGCSVRIASAESLRWASPAAKLGSLAKPQANLNLSTPDS